MPVSCISIVQVHERNVLELTHRRLVQPAAVPEPLRILSVVDYFFLRPACVEARRLVVAAQVFLGAGARLCGEE